VIRLRSRRDRSRGQGIAEFTLAIPLFLLLVLGIAEGSYYVVASTIVNHATHEGARLGVLESTGGRGTIRTRVKDSAAPIVGLTSGAIKLKLDGSNCNNTCYQARTVGQQLTVTTAYDHTPLVGYVFSGLTFDASAQAELVVEADAP